MKKKLFILVLLLFLFPVSVSAKELCQVTKGTGKNIGDEVKCGTEEFYVISNNDEKIELLAKYNLFVGDIIDYFEVDSEHNSFNNINSPQDYCYLQATEKGYNPYYVYPILETAVSPYILNGCRVYEKIEYEHVVQDSRAVGTRLDGTGHSILPLYGIVYMNPEWGYDAIVNNDISYSEYDENGNLILAGSSFKTYIDGYKNELERQEIEVESVSFITLQKTLKLLKDISGEDVEVNLEYPDEATYIGEFFYGKMDIKDYTENNDWIYDVTYWLGSGFKRELDDPLSIYGTENDYYISNEGMLCAIGRGSCSYFSYPIGNGIRPLVTITKSDIMYNIKVETDGNGTIEVVDKARANDFIQFKVVPKEGYKLSKLVITTDAGETVDFNEESIISNEDGTTSVDSKVFTMPYDNITIRAEWRLDVVPTPTPTSEGDDYKVPDTAAYSVTVVFVLILLSMAYGYYILKEKNQ